MTKPPKKQQSKNRFDHIRKYLTRSRSASIQEIVREPTSGGVIFRHGVNGLEILLIQDAKDRWTIPKGHIEEGETAVQTARREIGEEAGLHFRYRRIDKLVLMTTQIYLVRVRTSGDEIQKEDWMKGIKWFPFNEALDLIEYEDIAKLMLKAKTRIREEKL